MGGVLHITPSQIRFYPHDLNIGNVTNRAWEIRNVAGFKKGMLTFLYINFNDGSRIKLTVWKKNDIIREIEARRQSLVSETPPPPPPSCGQTPPPPPPPCGQTPPPIPKF